MARGCNSNHVALYHALCVKHDPGVVKRNYTENDLLKDILVTPSATAPQVLITATTGNPDDSVYLANAVANQYVAMLQEQNVNGLKAKIATLYRSVNSGPKINSLKDQAALNGQIATNTGTASMLSSQVTADESDVHFYAGLLAALPPAPGTPAPAQTTPTPAAGTPTPTTQAQATQTTPTQNVVVYQLLSQRCCAAGQATDHLRPHRRCWADRWDADCCC